MACEGRTVLPTTSAQMQGCVPSNCSVKTLTDEWVDGWIDGWMDRQMHLERDREGLQTWKTLLALLSGDVTVEPHHRLRHCPFHRSPLSLSSTDCMLVTSGLDAWEYTHSLFSRS